VGLLVVAPHFASAAPAGSGDGLRAAVDSVSPVETTQFYFGFGHPGWGHGYGYRRHHWGFRHHHPYWRRHHFGYHRPYWRRHHFY
jgi:hypothetical protein